MQYAAVTLALAGSLLHTLTNKGVTVPEILVLRYIHGQDAVRDIRPIDKDSPFLLAFRDEEGVVAYPGDDEERERLRRVYEYAAPEEARGFIDNMFPRTTELPKTLRAIGISGKSEAARLREEIARMSAIADAHEANDPAPRGRPKSQEAA